MDSRLSFEEREFICPILILVSRVSCRPSGSSTTQVSTLHAAQSGVVSGEGLGGSDFGERVKKAEQRIRYALCQMERTMAASNTTVFGVE